MQNSVWFQPVHLAGTVVLAALLLLPSTVRSSQDYVTRQSVREFPLALDGQFSLSNDIGTLNVKAWDKPTVQVREVKKSFFDKHSEISPEEALDRISVDYEADPSCVRVTTSIKKADKKRHHSGFFDTFRMLTGLCHGDYSRMPLEVTFEVMLPEGCKVDLHNDIGEIDVSGVKGGLHLVSDIGNADIKETGGSLYARLGIGKIDIRGHNGPVDAKTDLGELRADLDGLSPGHKVALGSDLGSVHLVLPRHAAIDLDADCGLGSVNSHLGGSFVGRQKNSRLHGQFNGGGTSVEINASLGSINIAEK